jgi:antirestriction protein ArdC
VAKTKIINKLICIFIIFSISLLGIEVDDIYKDLNVKWNTNINTKGRGVYGITAGRDIISLRPKQNYETTNLRNYVALHELCHWTRHKNRLGKLKLQTKQNLYGIEESFVNITAAIIADELNIPRVDDSWIRDYSKRYMNQNNLSKKDMLYLLNETEKTVELITKKDIHKKDIIQYIKKLNL